MKAKVYFSEQITPEKVVELYKAVGLELPVRSPSRFTPENRATRPFGRPSSGSRWSRPYTDHR